MLSDVRYTVTRCSLSQLWVPPWLVFLLAIAIAYPPQAPAVDSLSLGAILLLPVSAWLALATLNSEPASQKASLGAAQGGPVRHRIALLLGALLAALALAPLSIVYAYLHDPSGLQAGGLMLAILAHLVACITGVTIAAALSRPLVQRIGFTLVWALLIVLALITIPHLPPLRLTIELLETPDAGAPELLVAVLVTLATAVAAGLLWWWTSILAKRRS
ncbi:hypothetical protein [Compostimonas suwonensis]|uniref:ABC-2 type transport system permease protein n=1 Tax=Compostimonas suwonensis TaxID=1048394 RepID=A0A2M9BW43_9MICO|nr:hypothetical protein [Compostimonas suwonensis]PJJ62183.1 hypothetical protein CLV54_1980 [Compostimonas suwonensis]